MKLNKRNELNEPDRFSHPASEKIPSSFRDPSDFLFRRNGVLYRQINNSYKSDYNFLMESGLYEKLTQEKLLIPHKEVDPPAEERADESPGHCEARVRRGNPYKIIQPEIIPFISYPYEWCFSQLKDAALNRQWSPHPAYRLDKAGRPCRLRGG